MKAFITASLLIYSCAIAQQRQQQQRAPLPPFLVGASQQVINEFQQLLSTAGQRTDSQMEQAIESWIARQSQQIQKSFQQFKQQAMATLQQAEAQHQAVVAKLSPEARMADEKLSTIAKSTSMTAMQKQAEIQKIISSLPQNVQQELQRAAQG